MYAVVLDIRKNVIGNKARNIGLDYIIRALNLIQLTKKSP